MSLFIQYLLKLSISLAIVWLFYQFVLRRLTFYNSNRWYLIGYTLLSFFIPFVNISMVLNTGRADNNEIVSLIPSVHQYTTVLEEASQCPVPIWSTSYDKWDWIGFGLIAGASVFFFRFVVRCISFVRMKRKAQLISAGGMNVYQVNDDIIPFSFGNAVFVNSKLHSEHELREIITHEFVHVKQRHTLDIIWSEWLCIINWYNPFAWLLKNSIRQNLEFIADNKVLENGVDKKQYQYLLLKVIGNNQFSIAQKFNFSSLKKRIAMMNKLKSARFHLVKFLFVLPLLAVVLISFRKQISATVSPVEETILQVHDDSIPARVGSNDKGYQISVIDNNGDCTILVRDKNGKVIESLPLTKWNANEAFYVNKYGELPPPPPSPPAPPVVNALPAGVKSISRYNNQVEVVLKNGKKETYDFKIAGQQDAFEKKYGEMPPPPIPPEAPRAVNPPSMANPPAIPQPPTPPTPPSKEVTIISNSYSGQAAAAGIKEYEISQSQVTIELVNGKTEMYDLTKPEQKERFKSKYGDVIVVGESNERAPVTVTGYVTPKTDANAPVTVIGYATPKANVSAPVTVTGYATPKTNASAPVTVVGYRVPGEAVEEVVVAGRATGSGTTSYSPAVTTVNGYRTAVRAPSGGTTSREAASRDQRSYVISGNEDILVVISPGTTAKELEQFRKNMSEKGVDLKFDIMNFNDAKLVELSGTVKYKGSKSSFAVVDFKKLVLAVVEVEGKVYIKVNSEPREVI